MEKAGKLLNILFMRDDNLVPAFRRALEETGQSHVARMLHNEGLHTSAVLLFLHLKCISIKQIIISDAAKMCSLL